MGFLFDSSVIELRVFSSLSLSVRKRKRKVHNIIEI